jgi:hypothetical protein
MRNTPTLGTRSSFVVVGLRLALGLVLGLALGVAACSSSSGGNADAFVGTWTFTSGTITPMNCSIGGNSVPPVDLTGQTLVVTKIDDSHVSVALGTTCTSKFTTSGSTATVEANQSCGVMASGLTVMVTISSWTMGVTGDSMTTNMSGSVGLLPGCTVSGTGMLTKPAAG